MSYNSAAKIHYLKGTESAGSSNRLVPAPTLSINPEFYYANDTIIGYTYNITLNGYATSLDLTNPPSGTPGFGDVLEAIQKIKNIFNGNDGTLVSLDSNNNILFKFTGITIRSLDFQETDNNWVNYAQYTIVLEANELQLGDCSGAGTVINCGDIPAGIKDSPELIDMKTYKVKSFEDEWTFTVDDNAYNTDGATRNEHILISYRIDVTGKHYFVNNKLLPAWEQAKNFAEFKLQQQVYRLNDGILKRSSDGGCNTDGTLGTLFSSGPPGLIDSLDGFEYKIYNEKVNCSTSEGEGSFSLQYDAILKKVDYFSDYADPATIHSYSSTVTSTDEGGKKNNQISITGSIQGLIEGGIIRQETVFSLPANGTVLLYSTGDTSQNKYNNAKITLDLITDSGNKKLTDDFAGFLGVSYSGLEVTGGCIDEEAVPPPLSFNLTHDYTNGLINYSAQYDTNSAFGDRMKHQNIVVQVQEKTPIVVEFVIPGREAGPIIQKINTNTPKKMTVTITGTNPVQNCCATPASLVDSFCPAGASIDGIPDPGIEGMRLLKNSVNIGMDGTYSVSREYLVCDN
jgi:hypothetical protein